MNVSPTALRTQALELTLALARHTDNNTAAATAGAVMFLRGMSHEQSTERQAAMIHVAYSMIFDAVGPGGADDVLAVLAKRAE